MKYRTEIVREGELLGPVDWGYDFLQHFNSMGLTDDDLKRKYCDTAIALLRQISEDPAAWEVSLCHAVVWKRVYSVGMYDGWPYWKPTPALLTSGTLGAEWHFFYDLRACLKSMSQGMV